MLPGEAVEVDMRVRFKRHLEKHAQKRGAGGISLNWLELLYPIIPSLDLILEYMCIIYFLYLDIVYRYTYKL